MFLQQTCWKTRRKEDSGGAGGGVGGEWLGERICGWLGMLFFSPSIHKLGSCSLMM